MAGLTTVQTLSHLQNKMSEELSPWQRYKQNLGNSRPWDVLNPSTKYVGTKLASERLSVCQSCPFYFKPTTQCKKCGCIMKVKTTLEHASCPLNKW